MGSDIELGMSTIILGVILILFLFGSSVELESSISREPFGFQPFNSWLSTIGFQVSSVKSLRGRIVDRENNIGERRIESSQAREGISNYLARPLIGAILLVVAFLRIGFTCQQLSASSNDAFRPRPSMT